MASCLSGGALIGMGAFFLASNPAGWAVAGVLFLAGAAYVVSGFYNECKHGGGNIVALMLATAVGIPLGFIALTSLPAVSLLSKFSPEIIKVATIGFTLLVGLIGQVPGPSIFSRKKTDYAETLKPISVKVINKEDEDDEVSQKPGYFSKIRQSVSNFFQSKPNAVVQSVVQSVEKYSPQSSYRQLALQNNSSIAAIAQATANSNRI